MERSLPRRCSWLAAMASVAVLLLAACGEPEDARPTATLEATETASEPAPPLEAAGTPGVLLLDYGPREGWDAGVPGAPRAALVPLDALTGEELPGFDPFVFGQAAGFGSVSPDARLLALAAHETQDSGARPRVIDLETWTEASGLEPLGISYPVWSADGRLFAIRGTELWEVGPRVPEGRVVAGFDFALWAAPLLDAEATTAYLAGYRSPQGYGIDVQGAPFIAVVDLETGAVRAEIPLPEVFAGQRLETHFEGTRPASTARWPAVALAPDAKRLYVAHATDDRVTVVDLENLRVERTVEPRPRRSVLDRALDFLGGLLVTSAEAKGGPDYRRQAMVSLDGSRLYVTGTSDRMCPEIDYFPCVDDSPAGLRVIDTSTLELVRTIEGVGHLEATPDGRRLLGTGMWQTYRRAEDPAVELGSGLAVIDAQTLEVMHHVLPDARFFALKASPGGRLAYTLSHGAMRWDGRTMQCEGPCEILRVIDLHRGEVVATRELGGYAALFGLAPSR